MRQLRGLSLVQRPSHSNEVALFSYYALEIQIAQEFLSYCDRSAQSAFILEVNKTKPRIFICCSLLSPYFIFIPFLKTTLSLPSDFYSFFPSASSILSFCTRLSDLSALKEVRERPLRNCQRIHQTTAPKTTPSDSADASLL
ncbi:MAG: hypothetical protein SOY88_10375 [Massilioclostridium sp.]|nr:hypothetical protein [Massilioclostridium sp.]